MNPLANPTIALTTTVINRHQKKGIPLIARIAARTPPKDAMFPKDKSNSSTLMIRVAPKLMIHRIAICLVIFQKFVEERKALGLRIPKAMIIATKAIIVPYAFHIDLKIILLSAFFISSLLVTVSENFF